MKEGLRNAGMSLMTSDEKVRDGQVPAIRRIWLSAWPHHAVWSDSDFPEFDVRACCGTQRHLGKSISTAQYKVRDVLWIVCVCARASLRVRPVIVRLALRSWSTFTKRRGICLPP